MIRIIGFALALLLGLGAAQAQEINCRSTAVYDAATNGSTKLITGVPALGVYVCGFSLWGGGTATVKFVTGTGTACATNETAITPAYSLVVNNGFTDASPVYRGLFVGPNLDVCIKTSAGVAVQAQLYYVQR